MLCYFLYKRLNVVTIEAGQETSVDGIVACADKALYLGKVNGRNRVIRADQ